MYHFLSFKFLVHNKLCLIYKKIHFCLKNIHKQYLFVNSINVFFNFYKTIHVRDICSSTGQDIIRYTRIEIQKSKN